MTTLAYRTDAVSPGRTTPPRCDANGNLLVAPGPSTAGGGTRLVDVTLTADTSALAAGDVIADTQVITDFFTVADGAAVLASLMLIGPDDQGAAMDILFLDANVSVGTENSAPTISDANALNILARVPIGTGDYLDLGGVRIARPSVEPQVLKAISGTKNLAVAAVNGSGTPTYAGGAIKLRIGVV